MQKEYQELFGIDIVVYRSGSFVFVSMEIIISKKWTHVQLKVTIKGEHTCPKVPFMGNIIAYNCITGTKYDL